MSDKAIHKLQKRHAKEDKAHETEALQGLLKTYPGRRFVWALLGDAQIGRNPFTANSLQTAFNCGELNQGQRLLARVVEVNPEAYVQMMKENVDVRSSRASELEYARANASGDDPEY